MRPQWTSQLYYKLSYIMPRKKDFVKIKIRDKLAIATISDYIVDQIVGKLNDQNIPDDADIKIIEAYPASFIITDENKLAIETKKLDEMNIGLTDNPHISGFIRLFVGYSKTINKIIIGVGDLYPEIEGEQNEL